MARPSVHGGRANRQTEHVNASLQNFITQPTDRDRATEERTTPTDRTGREGEAIHNNVDHEMIKRFLVSVRPSVPRAGTEPSTETIEQSVICFLSQIDEREVGKGRAAQRKTYQK